MSNTPVNNSLSMQLSVINPVENKKASSFVGQVFPNNKLLVVEDFTQSAN